MTLLLAAVAVAVGAAAQSVSGIGFSLVSGPLLVAAFGASQGIRVSVTLSLLVNLWVLAREHRAVMWRQVSPVLLAALVTTPVVAHLVSGAQPRLLRGIAGAVILVGVALVAAGRRVGGGPLVGGVAGAASATMNVLASTGGPAVVVYATGAGWEPSRARVSWQAYFLCLNLETTAVLGFPRLAGGSLAVLVLALLAGASVATALRGRVPARAAMATTLLLAASGGAAVLGSAILSG